MKHSVKGVVAAQRYFSKRMRSKGLWLTVVIVMFTPLVGRAQTTSAISGTVADPSGAIVAGAVITATNTGTNIQYHGITDIKGAYHITQLPLGSYSMEVVSTGFSTQDLQPFPLLVAQ